MVNITKEELKVLFPETEVELVGKKFKIRPFSFIETRKVVKHLQGVLNIFTTPNITAEIMGDIYDKSFDGLVEVISMSYDIDKEIVEQFDLGTTLKAIRSIVEVNKDFFTDSAGAEVDKIVEILGMNEGKAKTTKTARSQKR